MMVEGTLEAESDALHVKIKKKLKIKNFGGLGPNNHIWAYWPKISKSGISWQKMIA